MNMPLELSRLFSSVSIAAALAVATLATSTYPNEAAAQTVDTTELRIVQPLNENWRFVQDDELTETEALSTTADDWETVNLPHTWNAEDAASLEAEDYVRGLGWYRLEFPSPEAGVRHWLEFGAASMVADVWLNGQHLGQHKGAVTQFRFDVTDLLAEAGTMNVLLVRADNSEPESDADLTAIPPMRGDFNISGGLHRHVALISTPNAAHFDLADLGGPGVYAMTAPGLTSAAATVNVRTKLRNDGQAPGDYIVRVSLLDADGQVAASAEQPITLGPALDAELAQDLSVASPHLWHGLVDPYLYQLVAELLRAADGAPIDKVVHSFGIREGRFDANEGFFLNGEHIGRLNGVGMQLDLLGKGWAQTNEDWDNSLSHIIEIGANAVRFAHVPYPHYAYQRASELGLFAWPEAALGIFTTVRRCTQADATPEFVANAQQQLQELIRQNYNHASIFTWAIGNESTQGQFNCEEPYDNVTPVLRAMHETAKAEDPSRPTSYVEFPHSPTREGPLATEGITDLFASNRYYLWYTPEFEQFGPLLDALRALTPNQPLAIGEYGAGGAFTHHTDNPLGGYPEVRSAPEGETSYQPEEYQAYAHEENYRLLSSKSFLWGTFVWNMFDFGSAHRNEGDVLGVNTKGLMGFDHQTRKDAFYFYKANWNPEPTTYIVGRRHTDRPYPLVDVKVYSNADSVDLMVNGTLIGTMTADQCEQRTCVFLDVPLTEGPNTVTATGNHAGTPVADTVEWQLDTSTGINIAAGRLASGYVSVNGTRFGSDDFFFGGRAGPSPRDAAAEFGLGEGVSVRGTEDDQLYKYFRAGEFVYDIPVADGTYEVTLGFLEPVAGAGGSEGDRLGVGDRIFNVNANGQPVLENFNILDEADAGLTAVTHTFPVEVVGGQLVLAFIPVEGEAIVSNIKIVRQQ